MDIVDKIENTEPTEDAQASESVKNKPYTEETFKETWQSFYMQNMETLRRAYEQIGTALEAEMSEQIPDFNKAGTHKEIFEESVYKKIHDIGAQNAIMNIINGGLVVFCDVGRRYGFELSELQQTLENINQKPEVEKNTITNLGDENAGV